MIKQFAFIVYNNTNKYSTRYNIGFKTWIVDTHNSSRYSYVN